MGRGAAGWGEEQRGGARSSGGGCPVARGVGAHRGQGRVPTIAAQSLLSPRSSCCHPAAAAVTAQPSQRLRGGAGGCGVVRPCWVTGGCVELACIVARVACLPLRRSRPCHSAAPVVTPRLLLSPRSHPNGCGVVRWAAGWRGGLRGGAGGCGVARGVRGAAAPVRGASAGRSFRAAAATGRPSTRRAAARRGPGRPRGRPRRRHRRRSRSRTPAPGCGSGTARGTPAGRPSRGTPAAARR